MENASPMVRVNPWRAALVCSGAAAYFFFEFLQLNLFNALNPQLIQAFKIDAAALGHLSAFYFYGIVLCLQVAGMILDRVSTRLIILCSMSVCILCTAAFSMATALWQAELCRFIVGVVGSFCFLSNVRLASRWFLPHQMARVIGTVVTVAMLGGMIAQTPFTLLTDHFGWRQALLVDAGVGVLLLIYAMTVLKDAPPGVVLQIKKGQKTIAGFGGMMATLKQVFRNRQNWLGGLYASLMNLPIFLLGAMWGSLYLVQVRALTRPESSIITSALFIGTMIGSPVVGWLSDHWCRRRAPMVWGSILSLSLIAVLLGMPTLSFTALLLIFFLLGFITSTQILAYPLIAESNPNAMIGAGEGLAATLIMAGGFAQPLFGWLMELHWQQVRVDNIPVYAPSDYLLALWIMPAAFILSLLAAWWMRETHCKEYQR